MTSVMGFDLECKVIDENGQPVKQGFTTVYKFKGGTHSFYQAKLKY